MKDAPTVAPAAPKTRAQEKSGKPSKKKAEPKEPKPVIGRIVPDDDVDEAARALHHQLRKLGMVSARDDVPLASASTEHFERVYELVDEVLYSLGLRTTAK